MSAVCPLDKLLKRFKVPILYNITPQSGITKRYGGKSSFLPSKRRKEEYYHGLRFPGCMGMMILGLVFIFVRISIQLRRTALSINEDFPMWTKL